MPIGEILLASIADAVIGQVMDKGGERVGASIKKVLGLDPINWCLDKQDL